MRSLFLFLGLLFFFLMIIVPNTYQVARGCLLSVICLGAFIGALFGSWRLDKRIIIILLMTVSASLIFMLNGMAHGAPGALRVGTVNVLWPLLYVFFAGFFRQPKIVVKFHNTIIYGIIVAAIMGLLLVGEAISGKNWGIQSMLAFQGAAAGVHDGYSEYMLFNMSTLIYGFPFLVTLYLLKDRTDMSGLKQDVLLWIALILTILSAAVSGRRAFWLIILLSPFIISFLLLVSGQYRALKKIMKIFLPLLIIVLAMSFTFVFDIGGLGKAFLSVSEEFSSGPRHDQFSVLMTEWMEKPLLGHGAGAAAEGIIRSKKMAWSYELSYVALLFSTGIIGICIYSAAVAWIFISGNSIVRRTPEAAPILLPSLAALAGFLIANATNPYLEQFDYLWTLFLPVAVINAYRTSMVASISS